MSILGSFFYFCRSKYRQMSNSTSKILMCLRTIVDTILSCGGSLAAILLVRALTDPIPGFVTWVALWVAAAAVLTLAGLLVTRSGDVVTRYASLRGYARLGNALLVKEIGMAILLLAGLVRLPSVSLSFVAVLSDILFTAAALFLPRFLVRSVRREEREIKGGSKRLNALVAGTDDVAVTLAENADASGHYNVLGYLSDDPSQSGRVIGELIVYYAASNEDLEALQWRLGGIDCILLPKGHREGGSAGDGASEGKTPANNDAMSLMGHVVKRSFDLLGSGLLMIVFSPLAALSALAVRLEDGGPAIYAQERLGRGGKPFHIYKFRSMRIDAEAAGSPALYSGDDDPRLTRVGKFLRQHHLDELPQLWNVFRGDMSFIGYRPERRFYIEKIMAVNPRYEYLFQIRPGVTSYATLYNGYTDTLDKMLTRLDLDLYYLRNHSLWFDARLLALTFFRIIGGKKF